MASTCTAADSPPSALRLVSAAHRAVVQAHPQWTDIAHNASPALQLAWMVEQGLLTYDELDELQTLEPEPSEADRIVEEVYALLAKSTTLAGCGLRYHLRP